MKPLTRIVVYGKPAPQGSKRFMGVSQAGHAKMVENSKDVRPWRQDVAAAALAVIGCACPEPDCVSLAAGYPLDEPLLARMVFTLAKPASAAKTRRTWPSKMPDLSKLLRATEDALTAAGVWKDDARVVGYTRLAKVYPGEDAEALDAPGVIIEVYPAGGAPMVSRPGSTEVVLW